MCIPSQSVHISVRLKRSQNRFLTLLHFNGTKTTPVAFCCFRLVAERTSQLHGGDCCWQYYVSDIIVDMDGMEDHGSPDAEVNGEGSTQHSQEVQVEVSADIEASVKVTRVEVAAEVEGQEGSEVDALEAQLLRTQARQLGLDRSQPQSRLQTVEEDAREHTCRPCLGRKRRRRHAALGRK